MPGISSLLKEVYIPKYFVLHAALLRQAFAHCAKFLTAASRRSLGRVSVPVWPITLSGRLSITALVGHYPTNKLMDRRLINQRPEGLSFPGITRKSYAVLILVSQGCSPLNGILPTCYSPVCRFPPHILARRLEYAISRSTCMCKARRQRSS